MKKIACLRGTNLRKFTKRVTNPLKRSTELPHDSIEDNKDWIEQEEPEKVNHEEDHQVELELLCEYSEEEHFDETRHVDNLIHEEAPSWR
jgi:hypothetical protein